MLKALFKNQFIISMFIKTLYFILMIMHQYFMNFKFILIKNKDFRSNLQDLIILIILSFSFIKLKFFKSNFLIYKCFNFNYYFGFLNLIKFIVYFNFFAIFLK